MDPISLSLEGANFLSSPQAAAVLEREVLPFYMPEARWFGGKARRPQRFAVEALLAFSTEEKPARLLLARVEYAAGDPELYVLPLQVFAPSEPDRPEPREVVIATFRDGRILRDALEDAGCRADLLRLIRTEL